MQQPPLPFGRRFAGPLATLALIVLATLASHGIIAVPGLAVLLLASVIYSVLIGGKLSGWISAALALGFYDYASSHAGAAFHYDFQSLERAVSVTAVTPFIVLTLGHLRSRVDQLVLRERALAGEADAERRRLRAILESITDGFFALDREWRYVYVNEAAEQLVGRTREQLLGRSVWDAFPELRGSTWQREYERSIAQQTAVQFEDFYAPLDAWFDTHAYPSPEGLTIYLRDITHRKQAEQAARRRARQQAAVAALGELALRNCDLQALLDATVATVSEVVDLECVKILELMPDGRDLLLRAGVGWRDGLVGKAKVPSMERSQAGYTLLASEPVVVEDLRSESRFSGPALLQEHGIVSGISVVIAGERHPYGVLGGHTPRRRAFSSEDIDTLRAVANLLGAVIARKKSEQALAESELLLRQLAEHVHEALFVLDATRNKTLYISPGYEEIWGRTCQSLYDNPHSWRDAIHPDDRASAEAPLLELDAGHEYHASFRIVRADGEIRWIRDRAFPVRNASGTISCIVGVAEDVTLQLASEENARRLAVAEAAVQAREEVLAVVSHDLRSPLNSVLMSLASLERAQPESARSKHFRIIARSSQRMVRLIEDLLDLAKIDGGRFAINATRVELLPLVEEACEAIQPQLDHKSLDMRYEIPAGLPAVSADRHRILQVLANLLGNAVKFTPEGGRIVVSVDACGDVVRVSIADTGPGIAREHIPHLFERFWQGRSSDHRGAGLGLAIVKGIVDAHRGTVEVASEPGRGATFRFTLPLATEVVPPSASMLAVEAAGRGTAV